MGATLRILNACTTLLSAGICVVYLLAAGMKVSPRLEPATHERMVAASSSWIYALHLDGTPVTPEMLRYGIAIAEMLLAIALMTTYASDAALALILIMFGAAYTHYRLGQPIFPPLFFAGMLVVLRAFIRLEDDERAQVEAARFKDQ